MIAVNAGLLLLFWRFLRTAIKTQPAAPKRLEAPPRRVQRLIRSEVLLNVLPRGQIGAARRVVFDMAIQKSQAHVLDNTIDNLDIPTRIEVVSEFKVAFKGYRWRWMGAYIVARIFKYQQVVMLGTGALIELFNALLKTRGIVLIAAEVKSRYADSCHRLGVVNIVFAAPGGK